jgi:iron complex transport system substrate-binding protein
MHIAAFVRFFVLLLVLVVPAHAAEWRYVDGAGKEVVLPDRPTRIIAHINAAAALIPLGIKPIGVFLDGPPSVDPAATGLDLEGVVIVGRGWYTLDAEHILNLDPDLIITEWWPREGYYGGAVGDDGIFNQINSVAPVVGPAQGASILGMIADFSALAESLGADLNAPALLADKAEFDAALARFKTTIAERSELTVLAASPSGNEFSVALPSDFAELSDLTQWGLNLVSPEAEPGFSFQRLSWENADRYPADIILIDDRWGTRPLEQLLGQPLANRIPAVAAKQLGDWPAGWIRSYRAYATQLDKLSATIKASKKL